VELGVYTFGDLFGGPAGEDAPTFKQRLRNVIQLAKRADEVGLDVFAVGEHHRLDMAISAPPVLLAAIAQETERIRLSSATTLLNTLDPVRVYEDFATLDLISDRRAEMIVGRGSFTESFGLFGYRMEDYDALFSEKLDLLLKINQEATITWNGRFRPSLHQAEVSPRAEGPIPIWIGVGGTPGSFARAGQLGLPLNLAILGSPLRFTNLIQLYRTAAAKAGQDLERCKVAISSHGYILDDGDQAREEHYRAYSGMMRKGLKNRFPPREITRDAYDYEVGPQGGIFAGNGPEVAKKILWERSLFQHDRMMLQIDWGGVPRQKLLRAIEILGTEVKPLLDAADA
jgi:probable LLM family oxidoreductase